MTFGAVRVVIRGGDPECKLGVGLCNGRVAQGVVGGHLTGLLWFFRTRRNGAVIYY